MREITYEQATLEAIQEEFRRDPQDRPPVHRSAGRTAARSSARTGSGSRRSPRTTSSGAAIGLAGSGFRTVANIRMATFGFVAMDQFMNHAAKITYMFGGQAKFPVLYRMTVGAGISAAAEHSVSPYPMYMNAPG